MSENADLGWSDRIDTQLNACSCEVLNLSPDDPLVCSSDDDNIGNSFVVIGCYQLNEETKSREGQLRLYRCSCNGKSFGSISSTPIHITLCDGVLDGKWISFSTTIDDVIQYRHIFTSATATGDIKLYELIRGVGKVSHNNLILKPVEADDIISAIDINSDAALCLALDLTKPQNYSSQIVSSYSNGEVAINLMGVGKSSSNSYKITQLEETRRFQAHSLFGCPSEVWACCWINGKNNSSSESFMTGADDCKLKGWDLRTSCSNPIFAVGDEEHSAGVTCICYHPRNEFIFASGSYDEKVRLWDIRKLDCRNRETNVPLAFIENCGGTWRLKWHPVDDDKLLVAGMHKGCKILHLDGFSSGVEMCEISIKTNVVKSFTAHESMAYGADWVRDNENSYKIASCSFYDHQAFIW